MSKLRITKKWVQFHLSLVIISHLYLTCSALREVPFNGAAWLMGNSYSSIKPREQTSVGHHTNTLLIPRLHGTVLQHGKQSHVLPHCKAMLISQAIKTFRLINKEKAYKRKECQTEEEEEGETQTAAHNRKECRRPNTSWGCAQHARGLYGFLFVCVLGCFCSK